MTVGALHEVDPAGDIVREDGLDIITLAVRILAAAVLLTFKPAAVGFLLLVGNPAIDKRTHLALV